MIQQNTSGLLPARVTYLDMVERVKNPQPMPSGMALALMRAENCPVHFYRYLYRQVGKPHHWNMRRKMSDDQVAAIIQSDTTILHVLYVEGCPAGFSEINLRAMPVAELLYFGLMPEFQGRGLARFFLGEVIANAWDQDPQKLIIQTNTLDSPRALQLYQKLGFQPVSTRDVMVEPWLDDV